jgi:hypothetical protein
LISSDDDKGREERKIVVQGKKTAGVPKLEVGLFFGF